jgi:hypothetical protein
MFYSVPHPDLMVGARSVAANCLGVILGMILGFFLIGAPLFEYTGDLGERMFTFFVVFVFYAMISTGLAVLSRTSRAYISLLLPGVMVAIMFFYLDGSSDIERAVLYLIYPLIAAISSFMPFLLVNAIMAKRERAKVE